MCGRFEIDHNNKELDKLLKSLPPDSPPVKIGEVFPGNPAMALTLRNDSVTGEVMSWGFPRWDKKGLVFNARAETALQKPMFASSLKNRPAVIPATGFYEWRSGQEQGHKEKFLFHGKDPLLYLAGFWNTFPKEKMPNHFTILTTQANQSMLPFHPRMPLILQPRELRPWLSGQYLPALLQIVPEPLSAHRID